MTLREIILKVRKLSNISMGDFSDILGVSRSTILRIERGTIKPSKHLENKLAAINLVGVEKYDQLSSNERIDVLKESYFFIPSPSKLTVSGLFMGLSVIASASCLSENSSPKIPIKSVFSGFSIMNALGEVLNTNNLALEDTGNHWKIVRKKNV